MITDAILFTVIAAAYALPWLVLTTILENTIWKD